MLPSDQMLFEKRVSIAGNQAAKSQTVTGPECQIRFLSPLFAHLCLHMEGFTTETQTALRFCLRSLRFGQALVKIFFATE